MKVGYVLVPVEGPMNQDNFDITTTDGRFVGGVYRDLDDGSWFATDSDGSIIARCNSRDEAVADVTNEPGSPTPEPETARVKVVTAYEIVCAECNEPFLSWDDGVFLCGPCIKFSQDERNREDFQNWTTGDADICCQIDDYAEIMA